MGLLVFLKTDKFCPLVRSVVVDGSSCLVFSLRYVVSVPAVKLCSECTCCEVHCAAACTDCCMPVIYIYIYIYTQ